MNGELATAIGRVRIVADAEALATQAAVEILRVARLQPPVGLFLAGGRTPRRSYERVVELSRPGDFDGTHVWLGDERMVPPTSPDSNWGMVASLWGEALGFAGRGGAGERDGHPTIPRIHRVPGGDAEAYAVGISQELTEVAGRDPRPDLALLGLGTDGHTASLFPGDLALAAPAGALFVPARGGGRVTATCGLLAASRRMIVLVLGSEKGAILGRVLADPGGSPAGRVVTEALERGAAVLWLVDRAAGVHLGSNIGAITGD